MTYVILYNDPADYAHDTATMTFDSENEARIELGIALSEEMVSGEWEVTEINDETFPAFCEQVADGHDIDPDALHLYLSEQYGEHGEYLSSDDVEATRDSWFDIYRGEYSSPTDWAEEFIADVYGEVVPDHHPLAEFITVDYDDFVTTLETEGWLFIRDGFGACHVFDGNV